MSVFFISYKRENRSLALEVRSRLEEEGIFTWMDDKLLSGDEWKEVIDKSLKQCLAVLVIVTPLALASQYVTYEWSFARGLDKRVIPIIFEYPNASHPASSQMHPRLQDRNQIDFSDPSNRQWDKLIHDLKTIINELNVPTIVEEASKIIRNSHIAQDRLQAIETLSQIKDSSSVRSAIEALAGAIDHPIPDVSIRVGLALAQKTDYKDSRAVIGLARAITPTGDHRLCNSAIDALSRIGSDSAVKALIDGGIKFKMIDRELQRIVHLLVELNNPLAKDFYKAVFENRTGDTNQTTIGTAGLGLGKLKDETILPELIKLLKDHNFWHEGRALAIKGIGELGDPSAVPDLIQVLENYPRAVHTSVAEPIIKVLWKLGTQEAKAYLERRKANNEWIWRVMEGISKEN